MTNKRKEELFDNLVNHITELVSGEDLYYTLEAIGFTYQEMIECEVDLDEEDFTDIPVISCPHCYHSIIEEECETDKSWDEDSQGMSHHILEIKCPYCKKWFDL